MKEINPPKITDRDNALFEAGIKLGTLYHQYVGSPIAIAGIDSMEKAIQESIFAQPYVESVFVEIDKKKVIAEINETFMYTELKGSMLNVRAVIRFNTVRVFVSLKMNEKLNYPLMQIDKIEEDIEK
ncbi:hypothetical protein MmiHf6_15290 [Methanimicrococcus hongohii]|uniref:Dihydroneopterin aldolase n=1 Tax=Methanimicrococcus hongohii TaxID=3028295 RepID=A0AA96ZT59_9EURY|nr:dihydroneopterin aldolase family protein [Methanimicrococcus sp. Hf6]WNY24199.1 hypothetical protein MmiHf6_15290 [Methanimicrococcus sp. Hf6]